MEEVAYNLRQFFENGKTYLTKETPFKDRHQHLLKTDILSINDKKKLLGLWKSTPIEFR